MRWSHVAFGLVFGIALVIGCSPAEVSEPAAEVVPETFTAEGTLTVMPYDGWDASHTRKGSVCIGSGGFDDIEPGAPVVVRDSKGERVGLGMLGFGTLTAGGYAGTCEFMFTVEDIPVSGDIYSVEVGSRGEVTFSRDEADMLALSLG